MKEIMILFTIAGIIATTGLTAFGQENKKAASARKEINEGKQDLKEAKIDSVADYGNFKKDAELKISENQNKISVLKSRNIKANKEAKEKYNKEVLVLEQRNSELETKIQNADVTKISAWSSFKHEVNHDLEELSEAIKKMTSKGLKGHKQI